MEGTQIQSFKDLNTWKEAHKLVLITYKVTKEFPREELFGLISQLRRAVISITSNIAEGFSRQTYKDKLHFYSMSLGSLTELENQFIASKDLNYISQEKFNFIENQIIVTSKLLNGLIKASKSIIQNT